MFGDDQLEPRDFLLSELQQQLEKPVLTRPCSEKLPPRSANATASPPASCADGTSTNASFHPNSSLSARTRHSRSQDTLDGSEAS